MTTNEQRMGIRHFYVAGFCLLLCIVSCNKGWGQISKDSSKYEKVVIFTVPLKYYAPTLDSMNIVLQHLGESMSVDVATEWKKFFTRQFGRLISDVRLDSVNLNPQPKLKK